MGTLLLHCKYYEIDALHSSNIVFALHTRPLHSAGANITSYAQMIIPPFTNSMATCAAFALCDGTYKLLNPSTVPPSLVLSRPYTRPPRLLLIISAFLSQFQARNNFYACPELLFQSFHTLKLLQIPRLQMICTKNQNRKSSNSSLGPNFPNALHWWRYLTHQLMWTSPMWEKFLFPRTCRHCILCRDICHGNNFFG